MASRRSDRERAEHLEFVFQSHGWIVRVIPRPGSGEWGEGNEYVCADGWSYQMETPGEEIAFLRLMSDRRQHGWKTI